MSDGRVSGVRIRSRIPFVLGCLLGAACSSNNTGVLFVGDSLTSNPIECAYPQLFERRHRRGTVTAYNAASFGSDTGWWMKNERATEWLAKYPIDIVVVALGTNDVARGRFFAGIADDLLKLRSRIEVASDARGRRPKVFVATIPTMYDPPKLNRRGRRLPRGDAAPIRAQIAAANAMLRLRVPADRLVDFDSWMPSAWDAAVMQHPTDGIHVGCGGQARRAEAVDRALRIP